jgi:hypothetical protein
MVWLFFLAGLIINAICFLISTHFKFNHVNYIHMIPLISILFFIIYAIKQKKTLKHTLRRIFVFMLGVFTISIVLLCYTFFKGNIINYVKRMSFNSDVWKKTEPKNEGVDSPRVDMIDDLLKTHSLLGKTRSEIDALLGVPINSESDYETLYHKKYDYVYRLGKKEYEYNKFVDFYFLVIKFDNNTVSKFDIKEMQY